ncbi:hypothetical protein M378DRAFT_83751 [Amanita muscaria Koide BX008]|uniref:Uncharacterized protein n=1 Tax=Amanita muscaria (strain Koide BX008) TaxID=946122 RepID=A0A0C2WVN5_AMAMK|nr:hypothetical protein M378DRAFT_83751 [Amanita muscaria Koide BX008]
MHLLNLNLTQLLIAVWRNTSDIKLKFTDSTKPDFIVFDDDHVWQAHGKLVASTKTYLPTSFDRPPRNPAKKISSGYKACEFMLYFWALGPAVFRPFLPHHLWVHFCKLVCGVRAIIQRHITQNQIVIAHTMLTEWEKEFEEKYYDRQVSRLHLVRPCVHAVVHATRETIRCGPLNLVAQWALENTIGNLGREVHQHSNPFSNLSERGLLRAQMNAFKAIYPQFDPRPALPRGAQDLGSGYVLLCARDRNLFDITDEQELEVFTSFLHASGRDEPIQKLSIIRWARLRLPNGQIARCAWKELINKNTRNSRNVKIVDGTNVFYGEVQFFLQFAPKDPRAFALVSLYSEPDSELLRQSLGTLWVSRYLAKQTLCIVTAESIQSVVGMVPFMLSDAENANAEIRAKFTNTYFVSEKPFLEYMGTGDTAEENDTEEDTDS